MAADAHATALPRPRRSLGSLVMPAIALLLVALLVPMVACGLINASIEFVAYRPLRNAPRLAPLITAIGMSFILQNVAIVWKGVGYVSVPDVLPGGDAVSVAGVHYEWRKLIILAI